MKCSLFCLLQSSPFTCCFRAVCLCSVSLPIMLWWSLALNTRMAVSLFCSWERVCWHSAVIPVGNIWRRRRMFLLHKSTTVCFLRTFLFYQWEDGQCALRCLLCWHFGPQHLEIWMCRCEDPLDRCWRQTVRDIDINHAKKQTKAGAKDKGEE